jgi:hypothetical protein
MPHYNHRLAVAREEFETIVSTEDAWSLVPRDELEGDSEADDGRAAGEGSFNDLRPTRAAWALSKLLSQVTGAALIDSTVLPTTTDLHALPVPIQSATLLCPTRPTGLRSSCTSSCRSSAHTRPASWQPSRLSSGRRRRSAVSSPARSPAMRAPQAWRWRATSRAPMRRAKRRPSGARRGIC